eukprot:14411188-Heterocapsa_arctica.AAC.1
MSTVKMQMPSLSCSNGARLGHNGPAHRVGRARALRRSPRRSARFSWLEICRSTRWEPSHFR